MISYESNCDGQKIDVGLLSGFRCIVILFVICFIIMFFRSTLSPLKLGDLLSRINHSYLLPAPVDSRRI